jgi:hypothetical protein
MSTHHYKTWGEAAGLPETAARMDRLPPDFQLSDDFPEPMHFDAAARRLVYRGFMSSCSYAFLRTCCKDLTYLRALDALFQETAAKCPHRPKAQKRSWRWLAALGVAVVAVVVWWMMR